MEDFTLKMKAVWKSKRQLGNRVMEKLDLIHNTCPTCQRVSSDALLKFFLKVLDLHSFRTQVYQNICFISQNIYN